MFGLDAGSFLAAVGVVLLLVFVLDLLVAGGAMSTGMMGGMAGMVGTPWAWMLLIVVAVLLIGMLAGR